MKKRILSLLMSCAVAVGLFPTALAAQTPEKVPEFWSTADGWADSKEEFLTLYEMTESDYKQATKDMINYYPQSVKSTNQDMVYLNIPADQYPEYIGYDTLEETYWAASAAHVLEKINIVRTKKDEGMTSLNGINVQLNGSYIKFSDAAPTKRNGRVMVPFRTIAESLGLTVSYTNGQITASGKDATLTFRAGGDNLQKSVNGKTEQIKMDTPAYQADGRTYVPVRVFAEALGLEVGFDSSYDVVILINPSKVAADIDDNFSIINRVLKAQNQTTDPEVTYRTAMDFAMKMTTLDSLNGDKVYPFSMRVISEQKDMQMHMTMKLNMQTLADLIVENLVAYPDDESSNEIAKTIQSAMSKGDIELIMDADTLTLYLKSAMLTELVKSFSPSLLVQNVDANKVWYQLNISEFEGMADEINRSIEKYQGVSPSMGTMLYQFESANYGVDNIDIWFMQRVKENAENLAAIVGDHAFKTSGSTHTLRLNYDESKTTDDVLDFLGYQFDLSRLSGTLTAQDNGAVTVDLTGRRNDTGDTKETEFTLKGSVTTNKVNLKFTMHTSNTMKLDAEVSATVTQGKNEIQVAPPEGQLIINLSDLLLANDSPVVVQEGTTKAEPAA